MANEQAKEQHIKQAYFMDVSNEMYLSIFYVDLMWFLRELETGIDVRSFGIDAVFVGVCKSRYTCRLGLLLLNVFAIMKS